MKADQDYSLIELFVILLKGWKTILISTILMFILSLGLYFLGNKTSYNLTSIAKFKYNQSYTTSYGIYNPTIGKIDDIKTLIEEDYFNFLKNQFKYEYSIDELKKYISFSVISSDSLSIEFSSLESKDLYSLQINVNQSLENYLNSKLQNIAKEIFLNEINNSIIANTSKLEINSNLIPIFQNELSSIPMLINQNLINPNYEAIAPKLQEIKNDNIILNNNINYAKKQINELTNLDTQISLPNIKIYSIFTNGTNVVENNSLKASILFPISFVISLMIGVFLVLIMNALNTLKQI